MHEDYDVGLGWSVGLSIIYLSISFVPMALYPVGTSSLTL